MMAQDELYALLQQSPEEGLRQAMRTYAPLVRAIVQQVLPHESQDAEECVADTFVALWQHRAALVANARPLKGWLVRTARNKAIDRYRSNHRKGEIALCPAVFDGIEASLAQNTLAPTGDEEGFQELIVSLAPLDREIFLRKYYALESSREIALALGKTEDVINARLARGRKKIRAAHTKQLADTICQSVQGKAQTVHEPQSPSSDGERSVAPCTKTNF